MELLLALIYTEDEYPDKCIGLKVLYVFSLRDISLMKKQS